MIPCAVTPQHWLTCHHLVLCT